MGVALFAEWGADSSSHQGADGEKDGELSDKGPVELCAVPPVPGHQ